MKNLILILFFLSFPLICISQIYSGKVFSNTGEALENVSIYLKRNPEFGSSTLRDGSFTINFHNSNLVPKDEIIFSYLGYKTLHLKATEIQWDSPNIILYEQPISLSETAIRAKISKKKLNALKNNQLQRLKEKLEQDFPNKDTSYTISSTINVVNDGNLLFSNTLLGELQELSKIKNKNKDSLGLEVESVKDYINTNIIEGIERMKENPIATKKNKWKVDESFYNILDTSKVNDMSIDLHKSLWEMNPCMKKMLKELDFDPKNWDITDQGDNLLFIYKKSMGFLGMIKQKSFLTLYINPDNYNLIKIEERGYVTVNIPIGIKIKGDMLELLNIINLKETDFEKFRLRHAKIDYIRNIYYNESENIHTPSEKSVIIFVEIEDNKNNILKGKSSAKIIIH